MTFSSRSVASSKGTVRLGLTLALLISAGCSRLTAPPALDTAPPVRGGVTANSGGDTRGTILYAPPSRAAPRLVPAADPYAAVSSKWVIGERQKMAWALAELDDHAHLAAAHAYPLLNPSLPGYTKEKGLEQARRQAKFNTYLLEKYHARFCNQFHLTYPQMVLILRESREKNWPLPPLAE